MLKRLFSESLPELEWIEFKAEGFTSPVSGVIYRTAKPPCCGMPLGGISTGCIDIDARGVYGFNHIYNTDRAHWPDGKRLGLRILPTIQPVMGLAVGGKTWVLASKEMISGEMISWCTDPTGMKGHSDVKEPFMIPSMKLDGVESVKEIHYWGHYPVVDMEYETDAPVSVGMRAWAPFLPGDQAASNSPGAVFEVHLRNESAEKQKGTIAFNFPGPDATEARSTEFSRIQINEDYQGVLVSSNGGVEYVLGVIGKETGARFGAGMNTSPKAWSQLTTGFPQPVYRETEGGRLYQGGSSSVAVDFELASGKEKVVRLVLSWYVPGLRGVTKDWEGKDIIDKKGILHRSWMGAKWDGETNYYTQMYAARYAGATQVARRLAVEHEQLFKRILAWQAVIYNEKNLPVWLKDLPVNNLYTIAEISYWVQAKPPLGDWCYPGGLFGLDELPRSCPQMDCIPCDWYCNHPIVFFYPELAASTLEAFKEYQRPDGEIAFALGRGHDLPDFATPAYYWQVSLNSMCYIDMVDRVWQRTGDNEFLKEYYESVKKANTFTMGLSSKSHPAIRMPDIGGMEWLEAGEWAGMATHSGGLHLAELRMMIRMAEVMGDTAYVKQCQDWLADGQQGFEEEMWTGQYYLNFWEPETGKKSDDVIAYQFDGEWASIYHGLPGVFQDERVRISLETIKRTNIALAPEVGAVNFARPDGSPLSAENKVAEYGVYATFTPELLMLAYVYILKGQKEYGIELARKYWATLVLKERRPWDLSLFLDGRTGERFWGTDYSQNMMLWAMPAALSGQDIEGFSAPGNLVDRIIKASL